MAQRMDIIDAPSTSEQASEVPSNANREQTANKPTCIICLGMAGSGKTTFMQVCNITRLCDCGFLFTSHFQRISAHLYSKNCPPYCINLDPAVNQVSFPANIGVYLFVCHGLCVHVLVKYSLFISWAAERVGLWGCSPTSF